MSKEILAKHELDHQQPADDAPAQRHPLRACAIIVRIGVAQDAGNRGQASASRPISAKRSALAKGFAAATCSETRDRELKPTACQRTEPIPITLMAAMRDSVRNQRRRCNAILLDTAITEWPRIDGPALRGVERCLAPGRCPLQQHGDGV